MTAVVIGRRAEADLRRIVLYIAEQSSIDTAEAYRERLQRFLALLETFPEAGRSLRSGDRKLGFERRMTIVYRVRRDDVLILRVLYAGQDQPKSQEPS